jgi:hypothetical protein
MEDAKPPYTTMKAIPFLSLAALFALTSCDVKVDNSDPPSKTTVVTPGEKKVEHNTTIVNPPAEKKVENNTTIVNPPAEKKVEKNTTIINPPKP